MLCNNKTYTKCTHILISDIVSLQIYIYMYIGILTQKLNRWLSRKKGVDKSHPCLKKPIVEILQVNVIAFDFIIIFASCSYAFPVVNISILIFF